MAKNLTSAVGSAATAPPISRAAASDTWPEATASAVAGRASSFLAVSNTPTDTPTGSPVRAASHSAIE
jgi:hypothetical protein